MPLIESVPIDELPGYVLDHFDVTLPMSTFLVAFLISDFDSTANNQDDSLKIWHVKGKESQALVAAEFGHNCPSFFETYYDNYPHPWPKTDMAAIPDFNAGAMEN
jgi:aminopeptidase N